MSKKPQKTRQFRYRLYFWLMDACLVSAIVGFADSMLSWLLDLSILDLPAPFAVICAIILGTFNFIIPCFLMIARFLRDEYAEQLWRRACVVLAYATAIVPLVLLSIIWVPILIFGEPQYGSTWLQWWGGETYWGWAIRVAWLCYMLLFVAIFQFLRWRDSR
ncbi:hypothetical protein [Citromicrobium sp. WPS32]|uniref:hypothetical protein n=1 Tax=Citromicrobium sp. WPS32 TaxID=1634517 RepID=UPI0006C90D98|nr:hypothetical protein [Citromicrobium sp. WPS32]KPM13699.1 hypothetical protein WG75_11745 [Citromicrobium sp. WPS32]MAY77554.1 hypothetical protein [Citromicrobium sp.]|tara:strand:+ start:2253 stop:2738 length:486 start_codon:yes stop_codon:yes gene_type:complete